VEGFDQIALGSLIGELIPSLPIPNGVLIMFIVAVVCAIVLNKTASGATPLHWAATKRPCACPG